MVTASIIKSTYKLYHTVCHQSIAYTSRHLFYIGCNYIPSISFLIIFKLFIMYQRLLFQHRLLRLPHLIHNRFHFCHILFINIPGTVNSFCNLIQIPTNLSNQAWWQTTKALRCPYLETCGR